MKHLNHLHLTLLSYYYHSDRFGARDPAQRRIIQTVYTAGQRGFRARGPNIARQMSLSQSKIPYQPPVPSNSPDYQPSYDGYHDPNEDPSYKFNLKTPTYTRGEAADSRGTVNGAFSFVDDIGKRHDVQYEAGSGIGFHIKNAFPDSEPFGGLFYTGPNKPGTPPRGHSSIVQNVNGAYQFTASGPDQKRVEVSDSIGRVRGSYTYIDDKGVQRTVQYIAGPNIGYKVLRKGSGPIYSSVYPYASPELLVPSLPDNTLPSISSTSVPSINNDLFEPPSSEFGTDISKPDDGKSFNNADDFLGPSNKPFTTTKFLSDVTTERSKYWSQLPPVSSYTTLKPPKQGAPDFYSESNSYRPSEDSSGISGGNSVYSSQGSTFASSSNSNKAPASSFVSNNAFGSSSESNNAFGSSTGSNNKFYDDLFLDKSSEYGNSANDFKPSFSTDGHDKYDSQNKPSNTYLYPKPEKSFNEESGRGNSDQNDNRYSETNRNFLGLPPGVAVRAHVQSLDILPYGSKIPPPDETLQRHLLEEMRRNR